MAFAGRAPAGTGKVVLAPVRTPARAGSSRRLLAWLALAGVLWLVSAANAQAETNATFTAHYEHEAQVVTVLWTELQALSAAQRARGGDISGSVAALQDETASLYSDDQALSATGAHPLSAATWTKGIRAALKSATAGLAAEIATCTTAQGNGAALRARLTALVASARQEKEQVTKELAKVNAESHQPAFRTSASVQSALLQETLTELQSSVIELLEGWLLLADTSRAASQPVAIQGLAYTQGTISIPAKGEPPEADTVGSQPEVTDKDGHLLPDTGGYRLQGPPRFRGVAVDRLIGTVTVRPGATPGTYTITYTQGRASEQVTLRVAP